MRASAKSGLPRSTATSRYNRVEELSDTAVVAVLGMGVVFFFLAVLSALMVAAKSILEHSESPVALAVGAETPGSPDSAAGVPTPRFVAAAVAAFLESEPGAIVDVTARPWRRVQERG